MGPDTHHDDAGRLADFALVIPDAGAERQTINLRVLCALTRQATLINTAMFSFDMRLYTSSNWQNLKIKPPFVLALTCFPVQTDAAVRPQSRNVRLRKNTNLVFN